MPLKLSDFSYDAKLAEEGVWVEIGEGASLKLAKLGNTKNRKLINDLKKPYRSFEISKKDLPDDVVKRITIKSVAETVLLDWKGIVDDDGKEIPFSIAAAAEALAIDAFMGMVLGLANDQATFRAEEAEAEAKNSSTPLPISSSKGAEQ